MPTVCEVRLLQVRREFDRGYSYLAGNAHFVRRGKICAVPFGKANRPTFGIITEVREDANPTELKEILYTLEEPYSLTDEMMDLCLYFSSHLLCTVGELARTALPTGLTFRTRTLIALHPDADRGATFENGALNNLYLHLLGGAMLEIRDRNRDACDYLLKHKFARKAYLPQSAANRKFTRVIHPACDPEQLPEGVFRHMPLAKADVYRQMLRYLHTLPTKTAPEREICDRFSVARPALETLEKRGLISIDAQEVYRSPYVDYAVPKRLERLNVEQTKAVNAIKSKLEEDRGSACLLHGVTGSGKTRVMMYVIDRALELEKGVIFLVPEIGLTSGAAQALLAHFPGEVAVLHSGLSAGERHDAWVALKSGKKHIALGTRSAVFAPVQNLGLILMDEEQDQSYNADNSPRYHARDIARYRAAHENALLVLASATPDIETYYKAQNGTYSLCRLTQRALGMKLPTVEIVDLRDDLKASPERLLGDHLCDAIKETLEKKEQIILFMNRRGYQYAPFCPSCGHVITCPNCSVALTLHSHRGRFACCHYCGYKVPPPSKCPSCGAEHIFFKGYGTQRLEEEVKQRFPRAKVLRMDADTVSQKLSHEKILEHFQNRKADILLGTQMVTKGHDFSGVTLVGVVMADTSLYLGDYRASEDTFSLLTQVIGRAGRANQAGRAIIQTLNPDHEIFALSASQDYNTFYEGEIALRRAVLYPPFCHLSAFTLTSEREDLLNRAALAFNEHIAEELEEHTNIKIIVYGPIEPAVLKVNNLYRKKFIIKHQNDRETRAFYARLLEWFNESQSTAVSIFYDAKPSQF